MAPASDAERAAIEAERAERSAFLARARALTPYVAAPVGDEVFIVRTDDDGLGRDVFVRRRRNDIGILKGAVRRLKQSGARLPAEPAFVDVGANIGTTTVLALRRHGFSSAVAIEPSPATFRVLRFNLILNGVDERVEAVWGAAAERDGEVELTVPSDSGRARVASGGDEDGTRVAVPAVALDSLVERGLLEPARAGLLWIDVQGHEANVLAGATTLLDAGTPIVVTIRPGKRLADGTRPWVAPPDVRARAVERLRAGYTDVYELRKRTGRSREAQPIDELDELVDSFDENQDLLIVRR